MCACICVVYPVRLTRFDAAEARTLHEACALKQGQALPMNHAYVVGFAWPFLCNMG